MNSNETTHSIDYETAMNMLLKSLEKSEVFQLRRHISKMVLSVGAVVFALDIFIMGYLIGLVETTSALKENVSVIQQLMVQEIKPPVVEEIPQEVTEKTETETDEKVSITQEYSIIMNELLDRQECSLDWYLEYKGLAQEYEDVLGVPYDLSREYSENDIKLLQACVETETHGGSFQSKVNVANVIFNRLDDSDRWGDTISKIITSPGQFSYSRTNIDESTKLAIEYAYQFADTTQGAIYFNRGDANTGSNKGLEYIMTDDIGHSFFKDKTNYVPTEIIQDTSNDDDSVG